tara:strand:+ start:47 stop:253 length:207 start_codon:yes stop_codon:yes gene_type:complete
MPLKKAKKKQRETTTKDWKISADREVEKALYKNAMGFTGPNGKYYKPDTRALKFLLSNRKLRNKHDQN